MNSPRAFVPPSLHDLVVTVAAPFVAMSGPGGQIRGGADGCYAGDTRILSHAVLTVDDTEPEPLTEERLTPGAHRHAATVIGVGDPGADPTVLVERLRGVGTGAAGEQIRLVSHARTPVAARISLTVACDLADVRDVKTGRPLPSGPAAQVDPAGGVRWERAGRVVSAALRPTPATLDPDGDTVQVQWDVALEPHGQWAAELSVTVAGGPEPVVAAAAAPAFEPPVVTGDRQLARLVERGAADAAALLLADPVEPADRFLGAGAPWYLTLFGRDSLWAARMLLPLGTDLAGGTLRTLARRQGTRHDATTEEAPGKILHELRVDEAAPAIEGRLALPPVYYGTVDATALWVSLLHDAWRWGMPADQIEALLPHAEAALGWLAGDALDERGFVAYVDHTGRGLANQGWKDSGDAVQFRDGTLADGPVALCEAQGYAVAAAAAGADLLEAFGRSGADRWRVYATGLAARFRERFWVEADDGGPAYPAIALDGEGRRVNTVTSNIGHLLGTGVLDDAETAAVVQRLGSPALDSGLGLRTLERGAAGYNPLSYHCGSVWPHDTAITIAGLARVGTPAATKAAASLMRGLVAAGEAFGQQLPELYGAPGPGLPLPYPAACHPQAWSAASAVVLLTAALGLDVSAGRLDVRPMRPAPFGPLRVSGLHYAGEPLEVAIDPAGAVEVNGRPVVQHGFPG